MSDKIPLLHSCFSDDEPFTCQTLSELSTHAITRLKCHPEDRLFANLQSAFCLYRAASKGCYFKDSSNLLQLGLIYITLARNMSRQMIRQVVNLLAFLSKALYLQVNPKISLPKKSVTILYHIGNASLQHVGTVEDNKRWVCKI